MSPSRWLDKLEGIIYNAKYLQDICYLQQATQTKYCMIPLWEESDILPGGSQCLQTVVTLKVAAKSGAAPLSVVTSCPPCTVLWDSSSSGRQSYHKNMVKRHTATGRTTWILNLLCHWPAKSLEFLCWLTSFELASLQLTLGVHRWYQNLLRTRCSPRSRVCVAPGSLQS